MLVWIGHRSASWLGRVAGTLGQSPGRAARHDTPLFILSQSLDIGEWAPVRRYTMRYTL